MAKTNRTNGKYKLTLSIDADFARRFDAYCGFMGEELSTVATRALKRELKGFTVSRRVEADDSMDSAESGTVRMARLTEGREAV